MDPTNRILESTFIRALAALIAVLAGTARLVGMAFLPYPQIAQWFATAALLAVALYFSLVILQRFALRSDARRTYQYTAKRYGFGYDSMHVECIIQENGSAIVQRTVTVHAYSELRELDTFLLIPEAPPPGQNREIEFVTIKSLTDGVDVNLSDLEERYGRLSAVTVIAPPLGEGDELSFQTIEQLPRKLYAIGLTQQELGARQTLEEYFGWTVNRPTRKLTIDVFFPENVKRPKGYGALVRYDSPAGIPLKRIQHEEQKRIHKPSLTEQAGGRHLLQLEMEYPMIGLIYVLHWRPLELIGD